MIHYNRLFPAPGTVELDDLRTGLEFVPTTPDLPHTIANFVSTADGRAAFDDRSAPLSDEGDRGMFHTLRERVEAILVGTGTLRAERYGRLIPNAETRERRIRNGLAPEPIACIVTRSGTLPTEVPLFAEPEARIIVFTTAAVDVPDHVGVIRLDPGELSLSTVARRLRADYSVGSLLCEGGPTIFASLLHEGLVNELFLTIAPKLAGGGQGPTITSGTELPKLAELRPHWILERQGTVFVRYVVCS